MSDKEIDELVEEAREKKEEFSRVQSQAQEVKDQLRQRVRDLHDQDIMSASELDEALHRIDDADYGRAREIIQEAQKGVSIEFEDEEKEAFAEGFNEAWGELEENVEKVRNTLLDMSEGTSRQDMKDMAYTKNSSMTKSEVEDVFDAVDKLTSSGVSKRKVARALSGFKSSVTISDAENVLKVIKDKSDGGAS